MPLWKTPSNLNLILRVAAGVYFSAVISWTAYRYYISKRGTDHNSSKKLGGDAINDTVEELDSSDEISDEDDDGDQLSDDVPTTDELDTNPDATVDIEDIFQQADKSLPSNKNRLSTVKSKKHKQNGIAKASINYNDFTEEQLTDRLRRDLSKQGYRLIESHSAVKICRWTKNSMRGRGGCYKHTFYGIKSYQCMEMTPNLACASKCTFCWRHHKNPVGTEWKWKMDPPEAIVEQGLANHNEMIRQLKGVPGVTKARFQDAQTVRHCALSLVGEPIFYPRINELLEILHSRGISTFLVTNAQFPDAMRNLVPVTQLYVSIDAPNKEALKKIDRPLYKDFWQRYIECLEILSKKKQRTVFRMTLVQKANMEDLEGYAKLVEIGKPDFIEIKGVTYCGTSKANKLTMENVPWHEQVVEFGKQLMEFLPENRYELACEHSHSNCILIADKKFKIDGAWHTWIDYDKFFDLIRTQTYGTLEDRKEFSGLDYAARTPKWAIFGSEEGGFDPEHMRWIRKDHKLKLLTERLALQSGPK